MGCDGGTIPRRDELVKTKKKPEQKDKDSELIFQWRCCALTQEPLQLPIVTCGLGKLYNKISIIEALLNKSTISAESHIKNLKDIKEVNLTPNPTYKEEQVKEKSSTIGPSPFICPVIGLEMTGKFRFVAIWSCGCVFSERAFKQIDNTKNCHKCQQPFEPDDVVILNGNQDDLVLMKERLAKRQNQQKKKKEKKVKTEPCEAAGSSSTVVTDKKDKKAAPKGDKTAVLIPASLKKRPGKLQESTLDTKKMKADYSVAKDPQASEVYKSLFTSHESEKEQNRAHWVTYNPFYN